MSDSKHQYCNALYILVIFPKTKLNKMYTFWFQGHWQKEIDYFLRNDLRQLCTTCSHKAPNGPPAIRPDESFCSACLGLWSDGKVAVVWRRLYFLHFSKEWRLTTRKCTLQQPHHVHTLWSTSHMEPSLSFSDKYVWVLKHFHLWKKPRHKRNQKFTLSNQFACMWGSPDNWKCKKDAHFSETTGMSQQPFTPCPGHQIMG